MLADKAMRARNREIFAHKDTRYVRGHALYKDYVLLFTADGKPDNPPQVPALVKTPEGFKRTNALSGDDTFDIVWSALLSLSELNGVGFSPLFGVSLRQQPRHGGGMDLEEPRCLGGRFAATGYHLSDLGLLLR